MSTVWKEGKQSKFTVEKPDKWDLSQVIKVNINGDNIHPLYNGMKMALYLCDFPLENIRPHSNHEGKTSDKAQLRDILQNAKPVLLKSVQVIKKEDTVFEKLSLPRET